ARRPALLLWRDPNHRQLNHIGRSTLQGSVDRGTFREISGRGNAAVHVGNRAATPEQTYGHAGAANLGDGVIDETAHTRVALEVSTNVQFGFLAIDSQLLRQSERRLPVDDPEVDGFRIAALLGRDHQRWDTH